MLIDFKEIESQGGYDFERFVEDLLESLGWTILVKAGQGPDAGRDIIASTKERLATGKVIDRKYVIQCKHFAHSGKTVLPKTLEHFSLMPAKHSTKGWLLVTSTKVSQDAINTMNAAEEAHEGIVFDSWDARKLENFIVSDKCRDVFKRYFPTSYLRNTNIILPTLGEVKELISNWNNSYEVYAPLFFVNEEIEHSVYSFIVSEQLTLENISS